MQFVKKHPSLFGWLFFYLFTQLLAWLSAQYVASLLSRYDTGPFKTLTVSIAQVAYLILNFVLFLVSIRVAVLPCYQIGRIRSDESRQVTFARLARKWFVYFGEFFIFSFPVMCVRFSALEVDVAITMAWQLVASYIAFRLVVHPWMKEITDHTPQDDEIRTTMA